VTCAALAQSLSGVGEDELNADVPVADAGVDSLGAVELRNQLSRMAGGKKLPSALVYDYPTARQIALLIMPDPSDAPTEASLATSSLPAAPPSLPTSLPSSLPTAHGRAPISAQAPISASMSSKPVPEQREEPKDVFEEAAGLVSSISSFWTQLMPWSASTQEAHTIPAVGSTPTLASQLYGPVDTTMPAVAYGLDGLQRAILNFAYQFKSERAPSKPPSALKLYDGKEEENPSLSTRVEVGPHVFRAAKGVSTASIQHMLEANKYSVYAIQQRNVGGGRRQRAFFMTFDGKSPYTPGSRS